MKQSRADAWVSTFSSAPRAETRRVVRRDVEGVLYQVSAKFLKAFGCSSSLKSSTEGCRPRAVWAMAGRVCRRREMPLVNVDWNPGDELDCRSGRGSLPSPKSLTCKENYANKQLMDALRFESSESVLGAKK